MFAWTKHANCCQRSCADYQHCRDVNICVDNMVSGNWATQNFPWVPRFRWVNNCVWCLSPICEAVMDDNARLHGANLLLGCFLWEWFQQEFGVAAIHRGCMRCLPLWGQHDWAWQPNWPKSASHFSRWAKREVNDFSVVILDGASLERVCFERGGRVAVNKNILYLVKSILL